ncbi:hypothetical protein V6N11_012589 [Hibiscus sabdariffa]|uniref:Uncharacterized protein n=1 Tax=Hibiscus sabdariffa TaxID=183260 RepID=A0ABR2QBY5_9ROSI
MFIISKRAVDVPTGQTDGNRSFKRQRGLEWVSREEPALEEFGGLMMCGFSGREYMNKGPSGECRCPTSMANLAWNVRGLVTSQEEKLGGAPFNLNDARVYYDFIDYMSLLELPISGCTFTWSNQRSDEEMILEKLDRVLCSLDWNARFPKAIGILNVAIGSDHAPIIILPQGLKKKYKRF